MTIIQSLVKLPETIFSLETISDLPFRTNVVSMKNFLLGGSLSNMFWTQNHGILIIISSKYFFYSSIINPSFRPIYLLCGTCRYPYNYILKFETISVEEPFFIANIGASGIQKIYISFNNLGIFLPINLDILFSKWENSNKMNISDEVLLNVYFEMLSNQEIQKLYEIYEADFQQFQYKFNFRGIEYNLPR